jgi:hypothetical protein
VPALTLCRVASHGLGRSLHAAQQIGQLGDVGSDTPRLVAREQVRRGAPAGLILEIDIGERLAFLVTDNEAGIVRGLIDGPRWRETA